MEKNNIATIMKFKNQNAIVATAMIFSLNISTANDIYIVQKGDTLSSVLQAQDFNQRLYGKYGALAATLKLNPQIQSNMGNKIFPNMKIILVSKNTMAPSTVSLVTEKSPPVITQKACENIEVVPENKIQVIVTKEVKPVQECLPSDDFKQSFYWKISPSVSWKNLASSDENTYQRSKINAVSNTNYGMNVMYGMHFEEDIDVHSQFSLESVSFSQDNSISLLQTKFLASRFGMGITYQKKWQLEVGMKDEFFLTSPTGTSVQIKKITLPELKASYLKDFYHYRNANLSYSISASGFLPKTSPTVDSKIGYGVGGALEAKLRNQAFKIGYDVNFLKADGNSTNSQNIYWNFIWETL